MKKYSITLFVIITILIIAGFFSLQRKPSIPFEQSQPALNEAVVGRDESGSVYTNISPQQDCSNECASFKNDTEKYTYCRTVCGFTSEEGVVRPPLSEDPTLSNDYTLMEEAIRDRDIKKCAGIQDAVLQKMCQVRVTEDLLEDQIK